MKLHQLRIIPICVLAFVLGSCSDSDSIQNTPQKEVPNTEMVNTPPKETPTNNNQEGNKDPKFTFNTGTQELFLIDDTNAGYGFYFYTPNEYNIDNTSTFPLLIHLHGGGARGEGNLETSMNRIVYDGPSSLIKNNRWSPPTPMIVVSPQSPHLWDPKRLHDFIDYLIDNINIDTSRIYMTGFSMGGRGIFDYVTEYGVQSHTAAVAPIAGWSETNNGIPFKNVALWAFHGGADNIVSVNGSINMVKAINDSNPKIEAKLTIFPGVDHFSWGRVYDSTGRGRGDSNYDAFDMTIYEWMLQYSK